MSNNAKTIEVSLDSVSKVAIEYWRLNIWVLKFGQSKELISIRHSVRELKKFLENCDVQIIDPTGQIYDSGLSVEVLDVISDNKLDKSTIIIDETVVPIVTWKETLIKRGQVILKKSKDNINEMKE